MTSRRHVAVLGAGIMGASTALFLARRGARVSLFDAADRPFDGASRWNEGKIHLGYLYAAHPTLETARAVLPGGLAFKALTESLLGAAIDPAVADHDDTYLVHKGSVASLEEVERYFHAVDGLIASHPDAGRYLTDLRTARSRHLTRAEIERDFDGSDIIAGFRAPERSLSTCWLADRFVNALANQKGIDLRLGARVIGVRLPGGSCDGPFHVKTGESEYGPFDAAVNALWHGRLGIDAGLGLAPPPEWSHRYRAAVFLRTARAIAAPCAVIGVGPFGDVKNYDGRNFYLSWYPAGLVAESSHVAPAAPSIAAEDERRIAAETFDRLGEYFPYVRDLKAHMQGEPLVRGGWVYAAGRGPLSDRASTLHRRDHSGIARKGAYFSVDTGKYSVAPWRAKALADAVITD